MAERTSLQKQSFSAPGILAQLPGRSRGFGRFILRPQICRLGRIKGREPNESSDNQSYFQVGFTLTLPFPFASRHGRRRNFCTASLLWCQELRYASPRFRLLCTISLQEISCHILGRHALLFRGQDTRRGIGCRPGEVLISTDHRLIFSSDVRNVFGN